MIAVLVVVVVMVAVVIAVAVVVVVMVVVVIAVLVVVVVMVVVVIAVPVAVAPYVLVVGNTPLPLVFDISNMYLVRSAKSAALFSAVSPFVFEDVFEELPHLLLQFDATIKTKIEKSNHTIEQPVVPMHVQLVPN